MNARHRGVNSVVYLLQNLFMESTEISSQLSEKGVHDCQWF